MLYNKFSAILGQKRLKITEVAKATGLSRSTLTALYYGRTQQISLGTVEKLCRYLGCGVGELLEYREA